MPTDFRLVAIRAHFEPQSRLYLSSAATTFRGALGYALREACCNGQTSQLSRPCPKGDDCFYARFFEGKLPGVRPSGFGEPPRPFVVRGFAVERQPWDPGNTFTLDIHCFDLEHLDFPLLMQALDLLGRTGLGQDQVVCRFKGIEWLDEHGSAHSGNPQPLSFSLGEPEPLLSDSGFDHCGDALHINFLSPTELAADGERGVFPDFPILINRLRGRISAISSFYGGQPIAMDHPRFTTPSLYVAAEQDSLRDDDRTRRSTRTSQRHHVGGFVGSVLYRGPWRAYLPWLRVGIFTGVGRQTTFGKGAYEMNAA